LLTLMFVWGPSLGLRGDPLDDELGLHSFSWSVTTVKSVPLCDLEHPWSAHPLGTSFLSLRVRNPTSCWSTPFWSQQDGVQLVLPQELPGSSSRRGARELGPVSGPL
jgi:hypothetical protein